MATAAQTKAEPPLEFHKGVDYACLLLPGQTTDKPLAHIYGVDRDVTRYGNLFAAAPDLLETMQTIIAALREARDSGVSSVSREDLIAAAGTAIAKAEGR